MSCRQQSGLTTVIYAAKGSSVSPPALRGASRRCFRGRAYRPWRKTISPCPFVRRTRLAGRSPERCEVWFASLQAWPSVLLERAPVRRGRASGWRHRGSNRACSARWMASPPWRNVTVSGGVFQCGNATYDAKRMSAQRRAMLKPRAGGYARVRASSVDRTGGRVPENRRRARAQR